MKGKFVLCYPHEIILNECGTLYFKDDTLKHTKHWELVIYTRSHSNQGDWDTNTLTTLRAGYLQKVSLKPRFEILKHLKYRGLVIYRRFHSNYGLRYQST